jgi:hypothetical protein
MIKLIIVGEKVTIKARRVVIVLVHAPVSCIAGSNDVRKI